MLLYQGILREAINRRIIVVDLISSPDLQFFLQCKKGNAKNEVQISQQYISLITY